MLIKAAVLYFFILKSSFFNKRKFNFSEELYDNYDIYKEYTTNDDRSNKSIKFIFLCELFH
jgi:hypothetical protein